MEEHTIRGCKIFIKLCRYIKEYADKKKYDKTAATHVQDYWSARSFQTSWVRCGELFNLHRIISGTTFNGIFRQCDYIDLSGENEKKKNDITFNDDNRIEEKYQYGNLSKENIQAFLNIQKQIDTHIEDIDWINGLTEEELKQKADMFCDHISSTLEKKVSFQPGPELLTIYLYILDQIVSENFMGTNSYHTITNELTQGDPHIAPQTVSEWKKNTKSNSIQNHDMLRAISITLCDPNFKLWTEPLVDNANHINTCIQCFKQNYLAARDIFAKLPTLSKMLKTRRINNHEKKFLDNLEKDIAYIEHINTLTSYSDTFLLKTLKILYDKGEYRFIDIFINDKFSYQFQQNLEYQYFLAHLNGIKPQPNYLKAAQILQALKEKDPHNLDLQTSLISNILRNAINDQTSKLELIFKEILEGYAQIFQNYLHYYPGINYAYMIALYEKLFDTDYDDDTIEEIHADAKKSIEEDYTESIKINSKKNPEKYKNGFWALISDFEFKALQDMFDQEEFSPLHMPPKINF